jgi:hypothetical protein
MNCLCTEGTKGWLCPDLRLPDDLTLSELQRCKKEGSCLNSTQCCCGYQCYNGICCVAGQWSCFVACSETNPCQQQGYNCVDGKCVLG